MAYVPIDQQSVPDEVKRRLREDLERLKRTGSMSGGAVTHEFGLAEELEHALRKEGLAQLKASLAITPSSLDAALDRSFALTGANSQGKFVSEMGWSGFFQLYKSESTNRWIELSEAQYDVRAGDGAIISPEFMNDHVLDFPATVESKRDSEGARLFNVHWAAKDRMFQLTTRNLSRQEATQAAEAVTRSYLAMSNEGWKSSYQSDPNNPLHRLAGAAGAPAPAFGK